MQDTQTTTKQIPVFITSSPFQVVPAIPSPESATAIRQTILKFFAAQIATQIIEKSKQK